jgi:NADPH:quinone reductase-like Zn-dependent oxidoreductase
VTESQIAGLTPVSVSLINGAAGGVGTFAVQIAKGMSVSFHTKISISRRSSNETCNPVAIAPGTDSIGRVE